MNPKILASLILVTLSTLFFAGCGGSKDVDNLINMAESHIAEGKLGAAEIELKNALREDQKNPQVLALMGQIYTKQGRLRDAYQIFSIVKQLNPNDAKSLASLASIKLIAGLRDEALADARKALELDPSHNEAPLLLAELANSADSVKLTKQWLESLETTPAIQVALGSLELKTRNVKAASEYFEKAISLDPNSALGYAGRFQILLAQGKQEEAMATFAKAAELAETRSGLRIRYVQFLQQSQGDEAAKGALDEILAKAPDYLPALTIAAELAAKMGQNEESRKLVDKILKLDPIDPTAMRIRGTLLVIDKKIDEAIAQLEKALELYPTDVKANYQIALAYLAKKDLEKAKTRLIKVVSTNPEHLEANTLLASVQIAQEDFSGAIITLENYLKNNPESAQGYLMLAEAYNRKGDNLAAISIYNKIAELMPETPQINYLSGMSYLQSEKPKEARSAFESALASDPLHMRSVEQLTALDMSEQNFDAALKRINQTIAATPNSSALYTIRAQILQSKGDSLGAIEAYKKSIELDANNRTARSLYARLLRDNGDSVSAYAQLQAILESNAEDIGAMTTMASIHETEERFAEAAELYEKMLTINKTYLPALNNLAYLYSTKIPKKDRAFELAQKARENSPNSPYTADTLGWIIYQRGDYDWARSLLSESYAKLGENAEVTYHLGAALYMLGDVKRAQDLLAQATSNTLKYEGADDASSKLKVLSINPQTATNEDRTFLNHFLEQNGNDPMALVTLGKILEREGRYDEAINEFRKAIKATPLNLQARLNLSRSLLRNGKSEEAQELVKMAISQNPGNPELNYLQGKIALESKNYDWALSLFKNSYATDSSNIEIAYDLGSTYYALGQKTEAIKILTQALYGNTNLQEKEMISAKIKILQADTNSYSDEMAAFVKGFLDDNAKDPQAIATLATFQLRNSETKESKKNFEKALELSPQNVFAKIGLAEILSEDPNNASRIYTMTSDAREYVTETNRVRALQVISLAQQGKADQAKTLFNSIDLSQLPESLRERITDI